MKVVFVLFSYFPYGGLQRDFLRVISACQVRGAEITVYCMSWKGEVPANIKLILPKLSGFSRITKRRKFVDYVVAKTQQSSALVVGFNKMPGLDYYYAADSCYAEKAFNQRGWLYRQSARCKQYLQYEKAVFEQQSSTKTLFIAPGQFQNFQKYYGFNHDTIIELPPGISKDRMADDNSPTVRNTFRQEFGLTDEDILILQVGSGFAIKGVDRSLKALAALPPSVLNHVHFFLVGQDKANKYIKLAKKLSIENKLKVFPGRDDIPAFLQGADILLHPAYSESAGLILLEAVVAGLPVLTTDTCGFAFHIKEAEAGLVCNSPFQQVQLNSYLSLMQSVESRAKWKKNGIHYGQVKDLYHMPDRVAEILMSESKKRAKR